MKTAMDVPEITHRANQAEQKPGFDIKENIEPLRDNGKVLGLIDKLCKTLSDEHINYCHWKSNAALERSACGLNDLDLLVENSQSSLFLQILSGLGFKQSYSALNSIMPGIHNYYAYDKTSQVLVNVHAHFQLLIGHDFTKNYHIPVEREYLDSSSQKNLFRVPTPEFELIIFVIRMITKHFTWDTLLLRHGKLSSNEKNELDYLLSQVSLTDLNRILESHFKFMDGNVFHECLTLLSSNCAVGERIRISQKMIHYLSPYARVPQLVDAGLKLWRRFYWPFSRIVMRKEYRKKMTSDGSMIAIAGGDGAGKTTVINGVFTWLDGEFAIKNIPYG